jgi:hypothetical protein
VQQGVEALEHAHLAHLAVRADDEEERRAVAAVVGRGEARDARRKRVAVEHLAAADAARLEAPVGVARDELGLAVAVLGFMCTGAAYLLHFRLIADLGASRALTVTFLIPVFGVLWGVLFLDESFTARMGFGALVVLTGTMLVVKGPRAPAPRPSADSLPGGPKPIDP